MKKCKGGCQMRAGGKTCMKCGCDMEDEEYEKGEKEEKEMRSGGMACMKCGGKMHKSGGTVSSCMKCGGGKYTFGGKVKWAKKYANGGLVYDDTEPPYDAPDTKIASGDGRLKRKKLSYAEKQYYAGLKNRNLDPTEANNMLRSAGYPTIYDIKNETTPMEPGMKMTQYDVYGDPNNALRPMYKNIMTDTSPNVLPGFKMFLGMINKPTPTSFGETFQEALSENNYLNAIKNLDEIKSKNTVTQNTNNVTPTQSTFLPFYFGKDRYDTGGHMTKGLDNIFYGLNEQKFYPTGLENRPVNQNWLSYKNRNTYSDKSASMSGASYMFGGKVNWSKKKINNNQDTYASGGMIKRADGSYSQRGLWDNIRANAGSGKKPTKQMLEQEKKIKQEMAVGGMVNEPCPDGFVKDPRTGECIQKEMIAYNDSTSLYNQSIKNIKDRYGFDEIINNRLLDTYKSMNINQVPINEAISKNIKAVDFYKKSQYVYPDHYIPYLNNLNTLYNASNKNILPSAYYMHEDLVPFAMFKKPTKPAVRVPEMKYTQEDLDKAFKQRRNEEEIERQKNLDIEMEKYMQDLNQRVGKEISKQPKEPDIYSSMKMTKYSPEDAKILYELQGMGPMEGTRGSSAYENDLDLKLKMYKSGSKFAPIMQQVGGYNNIPRHDFSPTEEDVRRFREEPGYRQQWDKDILMQHYGYKPIDFQVTNKRKQYSFGGAITGLKKYQYGGEIDNTNITNDAQIPLSKGSYEVPEPEFDANTISDVDPIEVSNNAMKGTAAQDYKKIVATNTAFKVDKSLPNWGYAKREQMKLNELIRKDISAGNAKMDLLVEDDIIGDKTLGAMRAYEASGQYVRPEGFKDKWLAEYKKQWDEMQATGKSKTNVPKDNNIVEQPKKTESKTMLDDFYSYFNKSSKDIKDKPVGYGTVLRPEESKPKVKSMAAKYSAEKYQQKQQSAGWPRTTLLQEGGIEVSTSNLKRKDFDTYFPISGASSSSSKGVRATGRDNNKSYFDAVEKAQTLRKDMSLGNTSLQLIDKLLSSSKKAIVIPKGQDKYGRELKDIYLQDPFNQERYHALDSIGVVEGEAIFGMDINPKPGSLTKRQEKITKQAQEKGGFKYYNSPSSFRKYSK